jgi:mycofactocin precursor
MTTTTSAPTTGGAAVDERDAAVTAAAPTADAPGNSQLVEEDLLVEDVSIDGMCGVY